LFYRNKYQVIPMSSTKIQSREYLPLPKDDDILILRSDVSLYWPVSSQTLARWASEKRPLPYARIGRRAVYRAGDLRQYHKDHMQANTPQEPPGYLTGGQGS
jgi:hypothetical protein